MPPRQWGRSKREFTAGSDVASGTRPVEWLHRGHIDFVADFVTTNRAFPAIRAPRTRRPRRGTATCPRLLTLFLARRPILRSASLAMNSKPVPEMVVRARRVRRIWTASPRNLRMVPIDGDTMEPLRSSQAATASSSTRVGRSRAARHLRIRKAWGSSPSGAKHEPRSEPPRVVIKSLNPEYDSYEHPAEEVRVVGRGVRVSKQL